jgi:putative transposase
MSKLRRFPTHGHPVFLTLVCAERAPLLRAEWSARLFLDCLRGVRAVAPFQMHGYVVLEDHVHLLLTPIEGCFDRLTHALKVRFAYRHAMQVGGRRQAVWQARYWDHVVRDARDLAAHLDYIHINPVKHGLASRANDWPWSSFQAHVQRGMYAPDWAADPALEGDAMGE